MYSAWAKTYYQRMEAQGKARQVILRALAFKWIRVLWKCWHARTPYDEARYLKQLAHRKSPYAVAKRNLPFAKKPCATSSGVALRRLAAVLIRRCAITLQTAYTTAAALWTLSRQSDCSEERE